MKAVQIISDMWRKVLALIAVCVGTVVIAMYFVNIHYDGRLEEAHKAHNSAMKSLRAEKTRDRNYQRKEISDRLDKIELLLITKGCMNEYAPRVPEKCG